MSKIKKLILECKDLNLHCSVTYQKITDFSVEIYKGYEKKYEKVYYTDGHSKINDAVKKAQRFLNRSY